MLRVDFDLHDLLGDILSPDGLFIDLLGCNEYTIWYLLRQAGLSGYVPVLGTKAFLTEKFLGEVQTFALYQDKNLEMIMANLKKYFGVGIICYEQAAGSIGDFIRAGIRRNQFVYSLYDHYFDTLAAEPRMHDYHGHPITGCDDGRQIYLSLLSGKYEVKYIDMQSMLEHWYKTYGTYKDKLFYLDSPIVEERLFPWMRTVQDEICCDCWRMICDWREELECFRTYVDELPKVLQYHRENQIAFALQQRLLFNSINEGMHGNFIFKLRLIHEILGTDTCELEKWFLSNRKKSVMIANMYRKASVLLEDGPKYFAQTLQRIAEKVAEIFIQESEELLTAFNHFIRKEGLIEIDDSSQKGITVCRA